jgi:hypothetical protein
LEEVAASFFRVEEEAVQLKKCTDIGKLGNNAGP